MLEFKVATPTTRPDSSPPQTSADRKRGVATRGFNECFRVGDKPNAAPASTLTGHVADALTGRSLDASARLVFGPEGKAFPPAGAPAIGENWLAAPEVVGARDDLEPALREEAESGASEASLLGDAGWGQQDSPWADPLLRSLAAPLSAAATGIAGTGLVNTVNASQQLDQIAVQLLRRLSVGNSGRQSSVRLELGEGRFAGLAVLVTSERGQLSVTVQGEDTNDAARIAAAIRARLQRRGLESVEVSTD
jgi:hypothetical protein